jgi:hypothetical protein
MSSMTVIDMESDLNVEPKVWTQESMMALLKPEEMFNGKPRAVGLRRISQIILGPIVKTDVQIPKCELNHAVVIYTVTYATPNGLLTATDAAESSDYNTSEYFMAFPVASTTTKASGRAFKSAIGLDVLTAEEMAPEDKNPAQKVQESRRTEKVVAEDIVDMGPISEQQKKAISKLCKMQGIDLSKFMNLGKGKYTSLDQVPKKAAVGMMELLNRYNNEPADIPETIKIVSSNGQDEFGDQ